MKVMLPTQEFAVQKTLTQTICRMLSPLEYLLFNVNMVFLADSYFGANSVVRASYATEGSMSDALLYV